MVTLWSRTTSNFWTLIGQNLTGKFMRKIYTASWKLFTLTAKADSGLCQLVMFLTVFFHWMCKMKYSCYQESSVIHGWLPLPNHMYFETDFKVFKMYFQYLNTILLYFNPVWQRNLNFRPCLKYILSVVKLYFMKTKTSLINLQSILFNKYD